MNFLEQGMRAQIEAMRFLNPGQYNAVMNAMQSMDRESYIAHLRQMASERGIDLDRMAARYGIRL